MAYDLELADRMRMCLDGLADTVEKKMFGGLAFMVQGNMACGIVNDALLVRVGPDAYDEALTLDHAAPMLFTGRAMTGFVQVEPDGVADDGDLQEWLQRGIDFALSLPPK